MIGEIKDEVPAGGLDEDVEKEDLEENESDAEISADAIDEDDNVGDISVEINVEELVAKLEATDSDDVARQREIRQRLDELEDQRKASEDLGSTYNFNLDDEL